MKLNFQLTTLLLTLTVGLAQTALAQESARAVVWCVTTSSKAKSLEKAREAHKALLEGLREQQTLLKVEDEDIFIDSPELHRIMYRTRPGGYEFRQTVYLRLEIGVQNGPTSASKSDPPCECWTTRIGVVSGWPSLRTGCRGSASLSSTL